MSDYHIVEGCRKLNAYAKTCGDLIDMIFVLGTGFFTQKEVEI